MKDWIFDCIAAAFLATIVSALARSCGVSVEHQISGVLSVALFLNVRTNARIK